MNHSKEVFWKVTDAARSSLMVAGGPLRILYEEKEWVYPNVGKIFIFRDEERARIWTCRMERNQLWKCEAKNPKAGLFMCLYSYDDQCIRRFWMNAENHSRDENFDSRRFVLGTPRHTVFADAIKLTERTI